MHTNCFLWCSKTYPSPLISIMSVWTPIIQLEQWAPTGVVRVLLMAIKHFYNKQVCNIYSLPKIFTTESLPLFHHLFWQITYLSSHPAPRPSRHTRGRRSVWEEYVSAGWGGCSKRSLTRKTEPFYIESTVNVPSPKPRPTSPRQNSTRQNKTRKLSSCVPQEQG